MTPLACLFERFDALALDGAATGGASSAAPPLAKAGAGTTAGAQPPAKNAPRSPLGAARRIRGKGDGPTRAGTAQRAAPATANGRVSFGTPVVHRYPKEAGDMAGAGGEGGEAPETPLWSNAGHTPYSLTGAHSGGGGVGGRVCCVLGVSPLGGPDFDVDGDEDHCLIGAGDGGEVEGGNGTASAAGREGKEGGDFEFISGTGAGCVPRQQLATGASATGQQHGAEGGAFEFFSAATGAGHTPAPKPAGDEGGETPTLFGGHGAAAAQATPAVMPADGGVQLSAAVGVVPFVRE